MSTASPWSAFSALLARRRDAQNPVVFWLRDDDAIEPTAALDRLLAMAARHHIPVLLAVIPALATEALAKRLAREATVTVAVHGWRHLNHAPPDQKKQELGPHRPIAEMLAELDAGRARLSALFGEALAPVLVPPWNRITRDLAAHLPEIGFERLSAFAGFSAAAPPTVNSTVDIMNWKGERGGRDANDLVADIIRRIEAKPDAPVGMLSHHLVHDEAAWRFLERLFAETAGSGCWRSFSEVAELREPPDHACKRAAKASG